MVKQKSVIVVGAGIIGASVAWHLARQGAAVTVVAEKNDGVATPASFAWINASWGNPEFYFRFRRYAMEGWKRLANELPGIGVNWCGSIGWDLSESEFDAYATQYGGWGYGIRRIKRDEIELREPHLAHYPEFALHVAEEGVVEPVAAAQRMLAGAQWRGARLLYGATASMLLQEGGRVTGVATTFGTFKADHVVLAAGAGAVALAETAGVKLSIETPPGLIVHSKPTEKRLNGLVLASELHMRQTAEGRIIAGADFGGSDPGANQQAVADTLFAKLKTTLKDVDDLALDFFTVGYRPTPKDGFPIIGKAENHEGLSIAVMHSGVTLAPAVGLLLSKEILSDRPEEKLAPFRLSRFGG
ncbi:FAD-dependent oxidoreductase [Phyllobacterium myrsinacearum]|uniref:Glycine/D-amino acid oxidase-like deaminating enzyme n=1 Tax=Phyllobacterium myrsinacearum TaxID=28101 RepID=A0A839EMF1_9HYPH|nr:glycine/D-amino acid oxidase-like deaminating enzyme [Phyllobacterium myrsinacearum]